VVRHLPLWCGKLTKPIEIYLAGRATENVGGVKVPIQQLAIESSQHWLTSIYALWI